MIQYNFKISDKLWQIGVIDDRGGPFHRLVLTKGTTYNSYFYTTIRGNTKKIANYISDKLIESKRFNVSVFDGDKTSHSQIIDSIEKSDLVLIGSATKYGDMIGSLENLLKALPSLEGKTTASFGSFAWSGEAIEIIGDYLKEKSSTYLTTSDAIKKTGCLEYEFPIRLRYNLSESNMKKLDSAIKYIESVIN
ncbi:MAG: flavodoxin domain-containing protein [Sphaerochaetaceae bacterium]|nr:flavodoxin domain-containing protein [Sphaerochaetaceae bacterium]